MMSMKKIIIIPLLLASLITPISWGVDFAKGLAAYESGDFATALREWTPLAEQGDAEAQSNLGNMYLLGEGVIQNDKTAVKWYTLAAEQGDAMAQGNLAARYAFGKGVIEDYVQSHMWANIAQSNGVEGAKKLMEFLVERMTPTQIAKAKDLAQECVAKDYKGC